MHDEESLDTPTGDAAEEFLQKEGSAESQQDRLRDGVKKLFNMAESINETLQQSFQNPDSIIHNWDFHEKGISFSHGDTYVDPLSGDKKFSSLSLSTGSYVGLETDKGYDDSNEPVILLEGEQVFGIYLEGSSDRDTENGVVIKEPEYELTLHSFYRHDKSNEEIDLDGAGDLLYRFSFSNTGEWKRNKRELPLSDRGGADETTSKVTSSDLEIVGMALSVLKSRVESVLSSSSQSE